MRETRLSSSEGGARFNSLSLPLFVKCASGATDFFPYQPTSGAPCSSRRLLQGSKAAATAGEKVLSHFFSLRRTPIRRLWRQADQG